jgi:hypothetical protein
MYLLLAQLVEQLTVEVLLLSKNQLVAGSIPAEKKPLAQVRVVRPEPMLKPNTLPKEGYLVL